MVLAVYAACGTIVEYIFMLAVAPVTLLHFQGLRLVRHHSIASRAL